MSNDLIFKKDEKEDPGSYSPVGFTLVTGKIMEKIFLVNTEKHYMVM